MIVSRRRDLALTEYIQQPYVLHCAIFKNTIRKLGIIIVLRVRLVLLVDALVMLALFCLLAFW